MLIDSVSAGKLQVESQSADKPKPKAAEPEKTSSGNKEERKPDAELLQQMLNVAQEHFHIRNIGLEFSVHKETNRIKVTVFDKDTGEMVREIPPQEVLNLVAKIDEMMGILFDKKA
ncbi:MAG: flagellar protein FlaG [Desulfobacterales bacterium]|nr:flagellar protein FlaG [Desulfobacterales bacterium]